MSASSSTSSTSSFPIDSTLLHPTFESYKLIQSNSLEDDEQSLSTPIQSQHSLPSNLSLSQISNPSNSILGHKDAKDRSLISHLVPRVDHHDTQQAMAAYVDPQGFLMLVVLDGTYQPSFHPLARLDFTPLATSISPLSPPPPPSLVSLPGNLWLATRGDGILSLIKGRSVPNVLKPGSEFKRWTGDLLKRWRILGEDQEETSDSRPGFRLLEASQPDQKSARVLVQSSKRVSSGSIRSQPGLGGSPFSASTSNSPDKERIKSSRTIFEVSLLELDLAGLEQPTEEVQELRPKWTITGDEPVYFSKVSSSRSSPRHLVFSEGGFVQKRRKLDLTASTSSEPTLPPAQIIPTSLQKRSTSRAQPYSWSQTSDTITLVFALPSSTVKKEHVRSHFQNQSLSVSLSTDAQPQATSQTIDESKRFQEIQENELSNEMIGANHLLSTLSNLISGKYKARKLWGEIDVEGSLWTLERPSLPNSTLKEIPTLLTLHLEKKHYGTRWISVFTSAKKEKGRANGMKARATVEEQEEEEEEADDGSNVPETLDPLELLNAVEGLDKYTASNEEGMDEIMKAANASSDFGSEQPSLLRDGLEEEDGDMGKGVVVSWVEEKDGAEGEVEIDVSRPSGDSFKREKVLASPLLSSSSTSTSTTTKLSPPLVIKHDLDGLVFHPSETQAWVHSDTLPALSFVLASKRDAHKIYIHSPRSNQSAESGSSVVLAFESASGGTAGNLFVYHSPNFVSDGPRKKKSNYASSRVLRLGVDDESGRLSGALVGVVALKVKGEVLVCLCEKSLVLLQNVL